MGCAEHCDTGEAALDISPLLQAKCSLAKSLFRVHGIGKVTGICELREHALGSIRTAEAIQCVEHTIEFTREMADDEDGFRGRRPRAHHWRSGNRGAGPQSVALEGSLKPAFKLLLKEH